MAAVSKDTVLPATAPVPLGKITSVTPQRMPTLVALAARLIEEAEFLASTKTAIDIGTDPVTKYELEDEEFEALD